MRPPTQSNQNTGQPMYGPAYLTPVNKDLLSQLSARASALGGGTSIPDGFAGAPSGTGQSSKKPDTQSTPTSGTTSVSGYGDEISTLMALVMSQNTPPDVAYVARERLKALIRQKGLAEAEKARQEQLKKFADAKAERDRKSQERADQIKAARAAAAEKTAAEEDAAIAAYDQDDAGAAREAGPLPSETEMSRTPVGTTRTPFGQMFGRFQSAPSPSTPAQPAGTPAQPMDPYAQALYNGEITPEQYRQLTEGSQQPGVSDQENAINIMTGHGQFKGRRLPAMIDLPTRRGWSNVPGSPAFQLPANQMEPMGRPAPTEPTPMTDVVSGYTPDLGIINASPHLGVIQPSTRDLGVIQPSTRDLGVIPQNNANNLMRSAPQQSLEALNAAEARLSLGQIGPMQAAELQRIRELKRRLAEDMANRQRGIF